MTHPRKAIILAAGKGTRMGSLTADVPKPMLPAGGKPLLEHILDALREAGITDVLLVVGYRRDLIQEHFAGYPLRIHYAVQDRIEGTASALVLGRDFAGSDPFLLTFGDIVCEAADYTRMLQLFANDTAADGVIGVKWAEDPHQGAAVYEENGVVTRVIEKPAPGTSTTHWNSAGLYTFSSVVFQYAEKVQVSPRGEYELTTAVHDMLSDNRRLLLYAIEGRWRDVGRPEDLPAVSSWLSGSQ